MCPRLLEANISCLTFYFVNLMLPTLGTAATIQLTIMNTDKQTAAGEV
jgi:hypothetical protein